MFIVIINVIDYYDIFQFHYQGTDHTGQVFKLFNSAYKYCDYIRNNLEINFSF